MVISFDDDILQLVAQVLLDGGLVLLLDFRVIGKDTDSAKSLSAATLIGGKKLLHRVRRVRAVIQDLSEGGMTRANASQRIAERTGFFRQGLALLTESCDLGLKVGCTLFQRVELAGSRFVIESGPLSIIARAHGSFQQVMLVRFELPQRFGLMYESFFGLLLLAVQPQQAFAGFR